MNRNLLERILIAGLITIFVELLTTLLLDLQYLQHLMLLSTISGMVTAVGMMMLSHLLKLYVDTRRLKYLVLSILVACEVPLIIFTLTLLYFSLQEVYHIVVVEK